MHEGKWVYFMFTAIFCQGEQLLNFSFALLEEEAQKKSKFFPLRVDPPLGAEKKMKMAELLP